MSKTLDEIGRETELIVEMIEMSLSLAENLMVGRDWDDASDRQLVIRQATRRVYENHHQDYQR